MNREELLEALKIRYVDLEVTLLFPESASVPRYKVSALRGGMGQVLLGQHCIRDENCEACDFAAEYFICCCSARPLSMPTNSCRRFTGWGKRDWEKTPPAMKF